MSARAPITLLPYRVRMPEAAWICGETIGTFKEKVRRGRYPEAVWKEGRNTYWRTADLIEAIEADGVRDKPSRAEIRNPFDDEDAA